jgi:DNA repair protein RadC
MLRLQMAGLEREVFMVLYLDNQHRLLESETVFSARLTRRRFTPVKWSKGHCVTTPLLSSWPITILPVYRPSQADRTITQRLIQALGLVDVRVLDHLAGRGDILSFAEQGC